MYHNLQYCFNYIFDLNIKNAALVRMKDNKKNDIQINSLTKLIYIKQKWNINLKRKKKVTRKGQNDFSGTKFKNGKDPHLMQVICSFVMFDNLSSMSYLICSIKQIDHHYY